MSDTQEPGTPRGALIDRREAVRRVGALLGGVALVGGTSLLAACEREAGRGRADTAATASARIGDFTMADVAFLDEVADTILPTTQKSPGAKAARVGAFMALMVTDSYKPAEQRAFRAGMQSLDAASKAAHGVAFTAATPAQRLALLETLDKEQHAEGKKREAEAKAKARREARERDRAAIAAARAAAADSARAAREGRTAAATQTAARGAPLGADTGQQRDRSDAYLPDQRQENVGTKDVASGAAVADDPDEPPPHYFRMMKELAMLGYFTSEIGATKAQRYQETPGRYDPCAPYAPGDPAWAPHA